MAHEYESSITLQKSGKYLAVILRVIDNQPNMDTVKTHETEYFNEAMIWLDDELSRLQTNKGVWDE